jgi:hypothetical protein
MEAFKHPYIHVYPKQRIKVSLFVQYKSSPITGPEGSSRLRVPDFKKIGTHEGGEVVSHTQPAGFTSQEIFLVLISVRG